MLKLQWHYASVFNCDNNKLCCYVFILQADIGQIGEALNSATSVLESIYPYVESSLPKVRWLKIFFIDCEFEFTNPKSMRSYYDVDEFWVKFCKSKIKIVKLYTENHKSQVNFELQMTPQ